MIGAPAWRPYFSDFVKKTENRPKCFRTLVLRFWTGLSTGLSGQIVCYNAPALPCGSCRHVAHRRTDQLCSDMFHNQPTQLSLMELRQLAARTMSRFARALFIGLIVAGVSLASAAEKGRGPKRGGSAPAKKIMDGASARVYKTIGKVKLRLFIFSPPDLRRLQHLAPSGPRRDTGCGDAKLHLRRLWRTRLRRHDGNHDCRSAGSHHPQLHVP